MPIHTDREYQDQLLLLKNQIIEMGHLSQSMLKRILKAFTDYETPKKTSIRNREKALNNMEVYVDELCVNLLAMRQPVASDLRFILAAMKQVRDWERIGDLQESIAQNLIEMESKVLKTVLPPDIKTMGTVLFEMIETVQEAFLKADIEKARRILELDKQLDGLFETASGELLSLAAGKGEKHFENFFKVNLILGALERLGDHCKNLAESVIFMIAGKDIRHKSSRPRTKSPD